MNPIRIWKNQNCFWKVLTTIGIVAIGFQIITLSTLAHYMIIPLGQRAAEDLSSVIVHAAETWHGLSEVERSQYARTMLERHKLWVTGQREELPESESLLPYLYFLRNSLATELGHEIPLLESLNQDEEQWFWVDVPVQDDLVRVGFSRPRIGVNPPIAFFLLLSIGLLLTLVTAAFLTRRLTVPIERLYQAAQDVGKGRWPAPIREEGPKELTVLTREFNRMNVQVRELLSNRTTLLAGIAHDLRTPLTQIQLALEMLPDEGGNPELMQSIRDDLQRINRLIGEALSIGLELEETDIRPCALREELSRIVQSVQADERPVRLSCDGELNFEINTLALQRIIGNLVVNALRYGGEEPVEIACAVKEDSVVIQVMDRGPGIPEDQVEAVFRPFHRLEASRGSGTGGSGLGLAIVRQLAEANRWTVRLLQRPGGGLIAELVIPVATAEA